MIHDAFCHTVKYYMALCELSPHNKTIIVSQQLEIDTVGFLWHLGQNRPFHNNKYGHICSEMDLISSDLIAFISNLHALVSHGLRYHVRKTSQSSSWMKTVSVIGEVYVFLCVCVCMYVCSVLFIVREWLRNAWDWITACFQLDFDLCRLVCFCASLHCVLCFDILMKSLTGCNRVLFL